MAVIGLRHIGLKILSIALAALLWVLVSGEQLVERALRVPLEFTNVPPQLEMVSEPPAVVEVRVRGSSGALGRIATGELAAVVDLREARAPQRLFHLTPSNVRAPFGVEVLQVIPSNLAIRFELSISKPFPVVPAVEGDPAPGFVIGTKSAEPQIVYLVGAASALEAITGATTEPVSVAGATQSVIETVTVGSPDPSVRLATPLSARVTINITAAPASWSVPGVSVQIRNADKPTTLMPGLVTIFAQGPQDAQDVRADDFDAWVDVSDLRSGKFDLPVQVRPPSRVRVVRVEPDRVRVTIR